MTSSVMTTWVGVMQTASRPSGIGAEAMAAAGERGRTGTSPPTPRVGNGSRGEKEKKGVSRGRKRQAPHGTPSKEHSHPILPAAGEHVKG